MEALQILSRNEMKNIMAGCGILVDGEWECGYIPAAAQGNFETFSNVTAYCCASCGQPGFLGAADCTDHAQLPPGG